MPTTPPFPPVTISDSQVVLTPTVEGLPGGPHTAPGWILNTELGVDAKGLWYCRQEDNPKSVVGLGPTPMEATEAFVRAHLGGAQQLPY